ncbi:MAG: hypothetical protein ABFS23_03320 [Pseudomonadota bacterium]
MAGEFRQITAVLPDDGTAHRMVQALKDEKGIYSAQRTMARGVGRARSRHPGRFRRRATRAVQILTLAVPAEQAEAIFEFLFHEAGIGHADRGIIWMNRLSAASLLELPEGIADEA